MNFEEYHTKAQRTAIYPDKVKIIYPALGLAGETGEVCEKIKKVFRDADGKFTETKRVEIMKELGDVLWYIAAIATDLNIPLDVVATENIKKLSSRRKRGAIHGSGDNR